MAYTTIDDPELYFQTVLWTGTGSSLAVTLDGEEDMSPNMIWIKKRSDSGAQYIYDTVRGTFKHLNPDETSVENADDSPYGLSAFSSNGFTIGTGGDVNGSSAAQVAWCWKAGTTSGITTDGNTTITPSAYSFNQTAGISILKHTGNSSNGAKMAHGLGAVPHVMIIKNTQTLNEWAVYHHKMTAAPETDGLRLNTTAATADDITYFYDTAPDSVNMTFGNSGATNDSTGGSNVYMSWNFTSIQGYSKFGGYTGNGNADGAFVYTGFRPAWLMIKRTDSTNDWVMYDNKREGYNVDNDYLKANADNAEQADVDLDLLSNGFKMRDTANAHNASGGTFIYMAFAEAPFVNSEGVPCNAR